MTRDQALATLQVVAGIAGLEPARASGDAAPDVPEGLRLRAARLAASQPTLSIGCDIVPSGR